MHAVLLSDYGYISGGAAQVAIASARALAEQGVQVTFACALGPVSTELDHPGISAHCLGARNIWAIRQPWRAAAQGIWNLAASRWLRRLLHERGREDTVIHLHQWTKAFSPSVLAVAAGSGFPFVVTLHDYFLVCPNGAYFVFPTQQPCAVRPMSARCLGSHCDSRTRAHKAVRLLRQAVTGAALRHRATPLNVIHVSHRAAQVARPLLPAGTLGTVVPNPCTPAPNGRVSAESNRSVVCIGRVTVEKGCVVLAQAAAQAGVPLVVMGSGPALAEMRAAYPALEVRPWGDRAAVEQCLADARVLALPSLWYETGGLVVQEALARGVPAIASTVSGAADVVGHEVHGLLVPPGDVPALAQALRRLQDDALVRRLSTHAYEMMRVGPQRPEAHAQGLIACYASLLAAQANSPPTVTA